MADTLKDFLYSVGFKLDESSQRLTDDAIKRTEERATAKAKEESKKRESAEKAEAASRERTRREADKKEAARRKAALASAQSFGLKFAGIKAAIALATEATAAKIVGAVDRSAQSFDRLTYLSRVTGASPGNITAFGYAARQTGSSQDEAESSLRAFGRNLLNNKSGYARMLEDLGVKTRDAAGNFRDSADIITDLGDKMRITRDTKPYGYANAIGTGAALGLDENLSRSIMNPDFRRREAQQKADQARVGADPNAAADGGTEFEQSARHLREVMDALQTKINAVLFDKLKPFLDTLAEWFLANGDRISDIATKIADDLISLARAIGEKVAGANWNDILKNVESFAKYIGDLAGPLTGEKSLILLIGGLGLALRALAVVAMPSWLLLLLGGALAASLVGQAKAEPSEGGGRGGPGGGTSGGATPHGRAGLAARIRRGAVRAAKGLTGSDVFRARGHKAQEERHAAAAADAAAVAAGGNGEVAADISNLSTYGRKGERITPEALVVHHTGGRGTPEGVMNTFNSRGFPAQYIMDRDGKVYRALPEGNRGAHIRGSDVTGTHLSNDNTFGIEVIANDDRDVTPAQIASAKMFYRRLKAKYRTIKGVYGHGYLNPGHKQATEGKTITDAIRADEKLGPQPPAGDPIASARGAAEGAPLDKRGFLGSGYTGRDEKSSRPLGDTPALHQSMLNNIRGDTTIKSAATYNVGGLNAHANLEAARLMADRAHRDLMKQVEAA